jgi:hypothetical protein
MSLGRIPVASLSRLKLLPAPNIVLRRFPIKHIPITSGWAKGLPVPISRDRLIGTPSFAQPSAVFCFSEITLVAIDV